MWFKYCIIVSYVVLYIIYILCNWGLSNMLCSFGIILYSCDLCIILYIFLINVRCKYFLVIAVAVKWTYVCFQFCTL